MMINIPNRNSGQKIRLNVKFDKIQMIRFIGALLESDFDFDFDFPPESKIVLDHLSNHFNIRYSIGLNNLPIIEDIFITHEEQPMCKIGSLEKPLVYPKEMLSKCKAKWSSQRSIKFSFTGLVTPKRKKCLDDWISLHFHQENIGKNKIKISKSSRIGRLLNALHFFSKGTGNRIVFENIGLQIFASTQGRQFPIKVWDEQYYDTLSKSQFVLCPDGDFTWTYRFFEAIICGAIPVVENTCNLYEGYHYFLMDTPLHELIYSAEIANKNFQRAKDELTFVPAKLNAEIGHLLCKSAK